MLSVPEVWEIASKSWKQDYIRVLKGVFLPCAVLNLILGLFSYLPGLVFSKENETAQLVFAVINICLSILGGIAFSIIVPQVTLSKNKVSILQKLERFYKQATIETLRTLPHIIAYTFLLLIPGIIKMVQFIFVVPIVQFDKAYLDGKVDALKKSQNLVKGSLLTLFLFYILFEGGVVLIELGIPSWLDKKLAFAEHSFESLGTHLFFEVLFGLFFEIGFYVAISRVFESLMSKKGGQHELAI